MILRQNRFVISLVLIIVVTGLLLPSCATTPDDPLKNTKILIKRGHASLYNNGAFTVEDTEISLIPPGPSAFEFALELAGMRARESFVQSIKNAGDSVTLVADGTKESFRIAGDVIKGFDKAAHEINQRSRKSSKLLIYKSKTATRHIIGESWSAAARSWDGVYRFGGKLTTEFSTLGESMRDKGGAAGTTMIKDSWLGSKTFSKRSLDRVDAGLTFAGTTFVEGYMSLPKKGKKRLQSISDAAGLDKFKRGVTEPLEWAKTSNNELSTIFVDTGKNYFSNIGDTFGDAKDAFGNRYDEGTLAILKSLGHVLRAIFWDGVIAPVGKITAASVGLVFTNLGVLPVMIVLREGVTTVELAVQVTWNTLRFGYDIVAPGVISVTAATLSVARGVVEQGIAAVAVAGGSTIGAAEYTLSKVAGGIVTVSGHAVGKTVQYVGVPLTSASIAITGTAVGVTVGVAADMVKISTGGAVFVVGEAAALTTQAFGVVLGTGMAVTGTVVSTVGGATVGVYELAKAVVVPTAYELTSGVVIGYTSMTQLAAHTILGVADASYLVLSLEGPRWVVYAVKGDLNDGKELTSGTILNLESMQDAGETFYYLPVSEQEMRNVIEKLPRDISTGP